MPEVQDQELFDPEFLRRLRSLFFKLRRRRQLKKRGSEQSPAAGFTREFKDHRAYSPGDDFRTIDWRLFARLEQLFIRIFEEVQEFHVHILLDRSSSMAEPFPEKRLVALRLAVALSYLALINDHRVSLFGFSDRMERLIRPLKGQGHIHSIIELLTELPFRGVSNLESALGSFRLQRDRRGIVFLISDLFGATLDDAPRLLRKAVSWPSETHVLHVLHPREFEPALVGELRLISVETGATRRFWLTKREMQKYKEIFENYCENLRKVCVRSQIDYVVWPTNEPFEDMFLRLLERGSALAGS